MDLAQRQCIGLIDEVDLLVADSTTVPQDGNRLVLSRIKTKIGQRSAHFNQKKSQLLGAMKETFIEPETKTVRLSQLITFCHQTGLELVTHRSTPYEHGYALVRAPSFDIVVEMTKST